MAIFLVDTLSSLEFAVAVFYVAVVMLVAERASERAVFWTAAACAFLTVVSFTITHGRQADDTEDLRSLVSLFAIGITAILAIRGIRARKSFQASERKRSNLGRFFSPAMVEQLSQNDVTLTFARELPAAVMFIDIVGFTALATRMPAQDAVAILRELLALMADAAFRNNGTIDKFLGDGLLAVFGAPVPGPRDVTNAVLCALDISRAMAAWNARSRTRGGPEMRVAIGIHFGEVVFGNVGTETRLELTVLGQTVNLASRLESHCRSLDAEILISGTVIAGLLAECSSSLSNEFVDEGLHRLRGIEQPIRVFSRGRVERISLAGLCGPTAYPNS